jgi:general secretion pathway protein I
VSRRRLRATQAGFTLLEVTVALAILGLGLVAVVDLNAGATRLHEESQHITVATELARAKLVDLEVRMNQDGFSDFDKEIDGTFEEEGRPEFTWKAEIIKPDLTKSTDQLTGMITGAMGGGGTGGQGGGAGGLTGPLAGLLGQAALGSPGGASGYSPPGSSSSSSASSPTTTGLSGLLGGAASGLIQSQVEGLVQQIQKGVREVRLTVNWKDGTRDDGFTVTTHMVVLNPTGAGITPADPNQAANSTSALSGALPAPGVGIARPPGASQ